MARKWIAILVSVLLVGGAVVALAQRNGRGPGMGMRMGGGGGFQLLRELGLAKVEARLNLSQDQKQQIQQIARTERQKMAAQGVNPGAQREALAKAIFSENPNPAEIQKQVQALEQQHSQMLQEMVSTGLQMNKVFTSEQRIELQKMIEENAQVRAKMRDRMHQRMQQNNSQPPAAQQQQ